MDIYSLNTNLLEWQLRTAQEKQEDPIKAIIQKSIQASCTVLATGDGKQWTGSGFHVGKGIVITAAHVAEGAVDVNLSFDGQKLYPATIMTSDPNSDVALLNCPTIINIIPPVRLADSNTAEVGDIIATVASPEGWNDTATVGRISNIHQGLGEYAPSQAWNDIMFIDADILQGSSGGMVIGTDGLVYGSVMGVTGQNAEIGIGQRAVCPSNKIRALLSQINTKLSSNFIDNLRLAQAPNTLGDQLQNLKSQIAQAAQQVYDQWQQGEDDELGGGGICDDIANAICETIAANIENVETDTGFDESAHHTYAVAYTSDHKEAYVVDIPPSSYERGYGYSWTKIPGVQFNEGYVAIDQISVGDWFGDE